MSDTVKLPWKNTSMFRLSFAIQCSFEIAGCLEVTHGLLNKQTLLIVNICKHAPPKNEWTPKIH